MNSILKEELLFTRRNFLISSLYGLISVPLIKSPIANELSNLLTMNRNELFITSKNNLNNKSFIAAIDIFGRSHFEIPVENRCHATTFDPFRPGRAVVFPKRPGYVSYLIDVQQGVVLKEIRARAGRFFYGHGSYSKDGKYLVATENDYLNKKGVISIWDGETMDFLGEMESYGIGPHELIFSDSGKHIIVANGGLFEHPDEGVGAEKGRKKSNVKEMNPSLCYIDFETRKKLAEYRPQSNFSSLRHLSLGNNGLLAIAIQSEGPREVTTPIVAFHSGQDQIKEVRASPEIQKRMNNFALSVLIEPESGVTCVTCPKGDLVTFWNANKSEFISSVDIKDPGGVALYSESDKKGFLITTGTGEIARISIEKISNPIPDSMKISNSNFDNHLSFSFKA